LTLKFTPQVFTNLDVQVKMSIESKDVLASIDPLTPTFTERTITGTARVQNNRTMMLASIRSQSETNGRRGLPLLGLIPVLGRLFTAPTRDIRDIDVVIAVTPRVLRAPAVTPRDEEMRPSGTLQSPTTGSLEAMIIEADRESQIAAGRRLPKSPVVQLPDIEPPPFGRAASSTELARNVQPAPAVPAASTNTQTVSPEARAQNIATAETTGARSVNAKPQPAEELAAFVPAPKSLVSDKSAAEVAVVNSGAGGTRNAALTSLPTPIDASAATSRNGSRIAQLSLMPANEVLKVGDKRRFAVGLKSDVALSLAVVALRFDPKVVKVTAVSHGTLFPNGKIPTLTQSVDPSGMCLIYISATSAAIVQGSGSLAFLQVEAIGPGLAGITFEKGNMHLVAADARDVVLELTQGPTIVKQ
jgi:general secretion pathway protein D